jgi:4-alpha-glucanotransferase
MEFQRASGILLHPTSLPGRFGIGDIGPEAYKFIDFLVESGQKLWQVLPLGPTGYGNSPYASYSAFAGNTNLISPELMLRDGFLHENDFKELPDFPDDRVDFQLTIEYKTKLFKLSFENFKEDISEEEKQEFFDFCDTNNYWLQDFAMFIALKEHYEDRARKEGRENLCKTWSDWEHELVIRKPEALEQVDRQLREEIFYHKYLQYQFYKQWLELKKYANKNNVLLIGDIPIFVAYDSADVWANPAIFHLDEECLPIDVAGVPPDYFSETGQLWGNPLYDWKELGRRDYDWWVDRFSMSFTLVDIVRVDHFRGFESYWSVPYGSPNAIKGRWKKASGTNLFRAVQKALGIMPVIAEDLGLITPDVEALRDKFHFPGMKIVQFAFTNTAKEPFLPHNYLRNCVVYPGTHDNDTCWGWFNTAPKTEKDYFLRYADSKGDEIHWDFIRLAMSSVADMSIYMLQDVFGLDTRARMNMPSKPDGNWEWRFTSDMITDEMKSRLKIMAADYGR